MFHPMIMRVRKKTLNLLNKNRTLCVFLNNFEKYAKRDSLIFTVTSINKQVEEALVSFTPILLCQYKKKTFWGSLLLTFDPAPQEKR